MPFPPFALSRDVAARLCLAARAAAARSSLLSSLPLSSIAAIAATNAPRRHLSSIDSSNAAMPTPPEIPKRAAHAYSTDPVWAVVRMGDTKEWTVWRQDIRGMDKALIVEALQSSPQFKARFGQDVLVDATEVYLMQKPEETMEMPTEKNAAHLHGALSVDAVISAGEQVGLDAAMYPGKALVYLQTPPFSTRDIREVSGLCALAPHYPLPDVPCAEPTPYNIAKFAETWKQVKYTEHRKKDGSKVDYVEVELLNAPWPDTSDNTLIVRAIQLLYLETVLKDFESPTSVRVVILGTPGIGKTYFAKFLAWYAAYKKGKPVIFVFRANQTTKVRGLEFRDGICTYHADGYALMESAKPGDVVITDSLPPEPIGIVDYVSYAIEVTSPNYDKWLALDQWSKATSIGIERVSAHVLPQLSEAEIEILRGRCFPTIHPEVAKVVCNTAGGAPRRLLEMYESVRATLKIEGPTQTLDETQLKDLNDQAYKKTKEYVQRLPPNLDLLQHFRANIRAKGYHEVHSRLINFVPDANFELQATEICTPTIARLLWDQKHSKARQDMVDRIIDAEEDVRARGDVGTAFEAVVLGLLAGRAKCEQTLVFRTKYLTGPKMGQPGSNFEIRAKGVRELTDGLEELASTDANDYLHIPSHDFVPGFDFVATNHRAVSVKAGTHAQILLKGKTRGSFTGYFAQVLKPLGVKKLTVYIMVPYWRYPEISQLPYNADAQFRYLSDDGGKSANEVTLGQAAVDAEDDNVAAKEGKKDKNAVIRRQGHVINYARRIEVALATEPVEWVEVEQVAIEVSRDQIVASINPGIPLKSI